MSLVKCVVCEYEISDQAAYCIKCGHPLNNNQTSSSDISGIWHTVTQTRTPINIFALAMMACASVLGASATQISNCYSLTAFTYSIHSFIAVSGMFF
ncbi:hypothetical protein RS130_14175 [Paraglaciecola aquimarina]|uniref:Zinc-ribbon domain-containing protein n=1 Tax=Paraglaciecola aquimarina TaxID=1235557 RepID=A0ABU3SY43_9ALTE|nr:zinc-ribbon domain-containing protein [Paraglaciecola aquimarina]MDU0354902.1 hypothetical protein [Paraglaciecola aquimarina]